MEGKPQDVPQDIWAEAQRLWQDEELDSGDVIIARAILAEREACAALAGSLPPPDLVRASEHAPPGMVWKAAAETHAVRIAVAIRKRVSFPATPAKE